MKPPREDNLATPRGRLPVEAEQRFPLPTDGRNIAPELGTLSGEGAQQRVRTPGADTLARPMMGESSRSPADTYYDLPLLQPVVWKTSIPIYFFVGGVARASCALGAALQLRPRGARGLLRRLRWTGAIGAAVSAGLLIEDLGRPSRFLYMLRVFRPTSPMSIGTWVITAFGGAASAAALLGERKGKLGAAGSAAGVAAGILGLPLAGYTAVLLANTAVPAWQGARTWLPPLFLASAATSASGLHRLFSLRPREERVLSAFGLLGKCSELCTAVLVEKELQAAPRAARALTHGLAGGLWRAAKVCGAASLLLDVLPGRKPWRAKLSGALALGCALATRLAIFQAGRETAKDPRASFEQQRARLAAQ